MVDGTALRGDVHTVEAHAQARNKTRAEDSHARESLRGSKCGLGNQRVGNAPDDTGPGPRARNDHLRNMSRLQRSSGSRSAQVNHVKGATAGHEDKSLVRGRVDGDTSEKGERARGAVLHRKRSCTSAIQSDLALEILLVRRGYRIRDAGLRRRSRLDLASKGIALAADGIGNGYLVQLRIVRDDGVGKRLPSHADGAQQLRRGRTRNDVSGTPGGKADGADRLVE